MVMSCFRHPCRRGPGGDLWESREWALPHGVYKAGMIICFQYACGLRPCDLCLPALCVIWLLTVL